MKKFLFGTKAETLKFLYEHQDTIGAGVLKPLFFMAGQWEEDKEGIYKAIQDGLGSSKKLIVRSSAQNEDSQTESMAGKYVSMICRNNFLDFSDAVENVFASYGVRHPKDQALVQEAVEDVECSGVAFTSDPNTGGRYYVINYDDSTGSADSVTSGTGMETKLYYWFPENKEYPEDGRLAAVCKAVKNLERTIGSDALDIEFLFSKGHLYILQARPLCLKAQRCSLPVQEACMGRIMDKIDYGNMPKPFLFGKRTMYGVMPDWNPAEMIGIHPRSLAASIYKEIITDNVWAYQRDNYGYMKLRSFPLMVDFCGFPYIDVRVSFNSFIPADLDGAIAEKLVNYYLERLEESPDKHDKVEFDIVFSCYTFDLPKRIKVLERYGFSQAEIRAVVHSLRNLTKRITDNESGLWVEDCGKLQALKSRREEIERSSLKEPDKAFWLLEDCKRYGTLPFAGLARAGFIAVQLLKSMVEEGILAQEESQAFMNDIQTVSSCMKSDYLAMEKEDFLGKYGFLRPGTYDICSKRYDESPEIYFTWEKAKTDFNKKTDNFRLSLGQMQRLRDTLREHGMGNDVLGLFSFIKGAIEGREQAKFIFTQNVSGILKILGKMGERHGFTRDEMSYMDIQVIKEIYNGACDEKEAIARSIELGKRKYAQGNGIVLPPLIIRSSDVKGFFMPDSQPTFVTMNRIEGRLCLITGRLDSNMDLKDRILLIESADPGYDWIFSHKIKGFITKYGGANSHMAIRAGELSIAAVIGVGAKMFDRLKEAGIVEIDAPQKHVRVLQ